MAFKKLLKNGKKILNRIRKNIIDIVVIGSEDLNKLKKEAEEAAKYEADMFFKLRWEGENKKTMGNLDKDDYEIWLDEHKKEYDEMFKKIYERDLKEVKKMWYVKNINRLIGEED